MSTLNFRLAERAEEFARHLFPNATREGKEMIDATSGARIVVEGVRAGRVFVDGSELQFVELVAMLRGLLDEDAHLYCADWLAGVELAKESHGLEAEPAAPMMDEPPPELVEAAADAEASALSIVPVEPEASEKPRARKSYQNDTSHLPDIHRLLPQSEDAEKGVLSSIVVSPEILSDVVRVLAPGQMHIPAHRVIFEAIIDVMSAGDPLDVITLSQRLRDLKQLEQVGGVVGLLDICTFLPTAANWRHYAEIVREKWVAREGIRLFTKLTVRLYEEQDALGEIVETAQKEAQVLGRQYLGGAGVELLATRRFDIEKPPQKPVDVFKLGEATIATSGNILAVQAKVKAGKSAVVGAMLAATMGPTTGDCLGFSSRNPHGHAVIHFDSEQSPWDHHCLILRSMLRVKRVELPKWLRSYRIADLTLKERLEVLRAEIKAAARECGGVLAVMIDGIADFLADPNDPEAAFALVDELHRLAIQYDCVIVAVLHENPSTEIGKTRGHLGSQLERKAETNLRLEKDSEGVTVMYSDRARHAHLPKDRGARFGWNDEERMHTSLAPGEDVPKARNGTFSPLHSKAQLLDRLSVLDGIKPGDLKREMADHHGMSKSTFYRFKDELMAEKKMTERGGLWFRTP